MLIPETETTDDFPEGAIKVWDSGGTLLLKVTDRTGTAILWERNGTKDEVVGVADAAQPAPVYPKVACEVCGLVAGNKGALTGHMRAKHPLAGLPPMLGPPQHPTDNGRDLPHPVIQALESLLSNATFQSVRKVGDKPMEDFFYGFASGMQAALAIVCGAVGYNTDFLNQENPDVDT